MLRGLRELGFDTGLSETPVIPIVVGDMYKALEMWKSLFENGVYTNVVLPPAVPPGRALLRTSYMATHTEEQLDFALGVFEKIGRVYRLI
jgi:7-keto-8-aminopelargonate synthetase-like enzyme